MRSRSAVSAPQDGSRGKLLEAVTSSVREKGYAATSVGEICARAGVSKGAFFHHFPSKEALAVSAADRWPEMSDAFFASAPYHKLKDPLERVLGYIDFRRSLLRGPISEFTCLAG